MKALLYSAFIGSVSLLAFTFTEPPSFSSIRENNPQSDVVIVDESERIVHELRTNYDYRRLGWLPIEAFPKPLIALAKAAEDKRYDLHPGVDPLALFSAAFLDNNRGGSTISMQTVKLLYPSLRTIKNYSPVLYKIAQILSALRLELSWHKQDILEAYLNLVSMRGELIGIPTASRVLFNKYAHGLTEAESAVLIALIPRPNATIDEVRERACKILSTDTPCSLPTFWSSTSDFGGRRIQSTPLLARRLPQNSPRNLNSSHYIKTTIDGTLQKFVQQELQETLDQLKSRNVTEGAVLVVENATGNVKAYVGNRGPNSFFPFVDGVMAKRQAGSTLKPFLYATAIDLNLIRPDSLLIDEPFAKTLPSGTYIPQNYDKQFHGTVSLSQALGSSLNIPAIRTLELVGPTVFLETLGKLGFSIERQADQYGLSLALGSIEVSLEELVNAYRTIAQNGNYNSLCFTFECQNKPKTIRSIFPETISQAIANILRSRDARSLTFGLQTPLNLSFPAAVKTGTSRDMRDNWCVDFSKEVTVGVWVGNFDNSPMRDVSGVSGAAPLWAKVMEFLKSEDISQEKFEVIPSPPRQQRPITRQPYFSYPHQGSLLALDPDIPISKQKVMISIKGDLKNYSVLHNEKFLSSAEQGIVWTPQKGTHKFSLVSQFGVNASEVTISVR